MTPLELHEHTIAEIVKWAIRQDRALAHVQDVRIQSYDSEAARRFEGGGSR